MCTVPVVRSILVLLVGSIMMMFVRSQPCWGSSVRV